MPWYRCTVPGGSVSLELRSRIAREFTRIHCELTGAPPSFVHVHFVELSGADESGARASYEIHGRVRAGRSPEVMTRLLDRLTGAFTELAAVAPGDVSVDLTEIPASWIMEGGEIAPEPGEEAHWLEGHARRRNPA